MDITHFSILYIDHIPDAINSIVWKESVSSVIANLDEGDEQPILRDSCRQCVYCLMVDSDADDSNVQGTPSLHSPTIFVRMLTDQRQMMVVVPYAIELSTTKFMGRPCKIQGVYKCRRPIGRTQLTCLMRDKARQYNSSIISMDGWIQSLECIRTTYESACASVIHAMCEIGNVKSSPRHVKRLLFPPENFFSELEERNEEVLSRRGIDVTPFESSSSRVLVELIDSFPCNRPYVVDDASEKCIKVYRRNPSFSQDIDWSGILIYDRLRVDGKTRTAINHIYVNQDERRCSIATVMLEVLAKCYPLESIHVNIPLHCLDALGFFRSSTRKDIPLPHNPKALECVCFKFDPSDVLPIDRSIHSQVIQGNEKK